MTRLLALLLVVAMPAHAQTASGPGYAGAAKATLPLRSVIEGKMVVQVAIDGQLVTLLVDTGAATLLDLSVARRLGLDVSDEGAVAYGLTGTTSERYLATIGKLRLDGLTMTNVVVNCVDLSSLRTVEGMPAFDGVLGADLFAVLRARIDFQARTLEIWRPGPARAP